MQLTLTGRVSFSEEITISQAARIIAFVDEGTDGSFAAPSRQQLEEPAVPAGKEPSLRATSLRDAIELSGAKTNAEKIVAFAAYVLQDGSQDTFTADMIKPLFRQAREQQPTGFARDLDKAILAGWIGTGSVKGELYLTAKAEGVIEHGFGVIRPKRGQAPKTRANGKKSRAITKPETFAGIEEIPHEIAGIPAFHSIRLKRDKMLWALRMASEVGVRGLSNADVMWLTDHLGDCIHTRDINGHFQGLRKVGYVNRSASDNTIRITPAGTEYLGSLGQSGK
ncbi:hypothetical protein [Glycomyces algeriensis]|uniref:hypothetical protein n=1 Tax=Glycomyces algeriensis TaxID=256037 RepID=UPI0022D04B2F|nr:hypothetical protein [Glycomyces algeriensis]MDA1367236.1 hypothetical protein [Glycomyces algeriensis]MDR7353380.1 hypothetical protein [Glycomyces algeriensis]